MVIINPNTSKITLNVASLNIQMKRQIIRVYLKKKKKAPPRGVYKKPTGNIKSPLS